MLDGLHWLIALNPIWNTGQFYSQFAKKTEQSLIRLFIYVYYSLVFPGVNFSFNLIIVPIFNEELYFNWICIFLFLSRLDGLNCDSGKIILNNIKNVIPHPEFVIYNSARKKYYTLPWNSSFLFENSNLFALLHSNDDVKNAPDLIKDRHVYFSRGSDLTFSGIFRRTLRIFCFEKLFLLIAFQSRIQNLTSKRLLPHQRTNVAQKCCPSCGIFLNHDWFCWSWGFGQSIQIFILQFQCFI